MGCCSSEKAIVIDEDKKDEDKVENEEIIEIKGDKEPEVVELERINYNNAPKENEDILVEVENKNEIAIENENENENHEEEEEEIPEDIKVEKEEEEKVEFINNNANEQEKSSQELKSSYNKTRKKKQNKKNVKKRPFVILEIQSSPYKKIKIRINACSFTDEYMMPIWCPKGIYIKFRVEGKWRIDKLYDYTDSKGMPSNHCHGFNYGALVGRIGLDKKFVVEDEGTFLVKKEGPLYLRQNLPKNMKISPEGTLDVSVYDGIYMSIDEINKKLGWIENGTVDANNNGENSEKTNSEKKSNGSPKKKSNELEEKELEKKLRTHFNNLRMNPSLFFEKYLNFNTNLFFTEKYLKNKKLLQKNNLVENETCYNFLGEYFELPNQIHLKKNVNKNNISENLNELDKSLSYYLYDQMATTVVTKSIITQKENQNDIIMQYLLDKKFRNYIFDERSQILIIKILKNFFRDSTLVIIAIGLDKDYSNVEIEKV